MSEGIQVIISCYNAAKYLDACLDSVEKALTGQQWALLLGDDCSTDGSYDVMMRRHTSANFSELRKYPKALNVSIAKNRLLKDYHHLCAEYPIICLMDADDVMTPARISKMLPVLTHDVDVVLGNHLVVNESGSQKLVCAEKELANLTFEFGPWATLFRSNLIPQDFKLFREDVEAHEDALRWVQWYVNGVRYVTVGGEPVHIHHYRKGTVSNDAVEEKRVAKWSHFQELKKQTLQPRQGAPVQSFCSVATEAVLKEMLLMIKSIRQYHQLPIYLLCDKAVRSAVSKHCSKQNVITSDIGELSRQFSRKWEHVTDFHKPDIIYKKMDALDRALENHTNTMFIDADLVWLRSFDCQFSTDLALSPHLHCPALKGMSKMFGTYNAGMLFCADKTFPNWWRYAFLHESSFFEQQCLDNPKSNYSTSIIGPECNYGIWRVWTDQNGELMDDSPDASDLCAQLGLNAVDCNILWRGKSLQSFHVHPWCPAVPHTVLVKVVRHCLKNSGKSEHRELLQYIEWLDKFS